MSNWKDFPRIDLQAIPIAESKGWVTKFDKNDKIFKRCTPESVPNHSVNFEKLGADGKVIKVLRVVCLTKKHGNHDYRIVNSWSCADVVGDRYVNPRDYNDIETALEKESLTLSI
jgi:hypothetical protein